MNTGYIYLITNKINGKKYVGQTLISVEERWKQHCSHAKDPSRALGIDGAINKYGPENFICEVIKECPEEELDKWEIYFIKEYNTYQGDNTGIGYNLTLGGKGGYRYEIDEQEMLQMYNNGKTAVEIAAYYGCSDKTIGKRLKKFGVDTKQHRIEWLKNNKEIWEGNLIKKVQPINIVELELNFNSITECAQWLFDNNYSKAKDIQTIANGIKRQLNGSRLSYLGLHFKRLS